MMNEVAEKVRPEAATPLHSWTELNRQWLIAAIGRLRARIEAGDAERDPPVDCVQTAGLSGFVPALVGLAKAFGLSPFERELLLLLAGLELDEGLRQAVVKAGAGAATRASFSFACAHLITPHWDALSPDAPLRHWRMMAPTHPAGIALAPLQIDERVLHFIAGIPASDAVLAGLVSQVIGQAAEVEDRPLVKRVAAALESGAIAVLEGGEDAAGRRDWALAASAARQRAALWIESRDLPGDADALALAARHIDREAVLGVSTPVLAVQDGSAQNALALVSRLNAGLIWLGAPVAGLDALPRARRLLRFKLPTADISRTRSRLLARWRAVTGTDQAVEAALERAARQFHLGSSAIDGVMEKVGTVDAAARAAAVWPAAREAARGGLEALAQRIPTSVTFDDIVLPSGQSVMLREMGRQLRQRERVYADWGFGEKYQLGQGLVALFAGESGTGKTLAAEVIAAEASLDLYRVDLATLVSKYIGETEKNLKRLFDAADASGAVLLFDEADALFGKRSEVKDSHDRYANIEVAYLLQRVEAYRGLAILTTNMKSALDRAFLRRIRFVVNFPVPDASAREQIWRRQFPAAAPLGAIDFKALSKLNICGGNIRSIAVNAAFKAADSGSPIDQALVMAAAHEEFAKLERSFASSGGAP